jgi:hypothetical protein
MGTFGEFDENTFRTTKNEKSPRFKKFKNTN